jgi:molecular chaperone DnaK (HSP70)
MSDGVPSIGIDFGTTNSSTAWFDPRTGRAEVIKSQGEDKTPSVVFFGEHETLVGKPADELIEDASNDRLQREEVFRRTVVSIKRNLIAPPRIALPGGRYVRPVDVVAEVLKNLKREAQEGHFHEEVRRAVITCPAEFNAIQWRKIEEGGRLAGFEEVALLEEPAAAALAYARAGLNVGEHVLVYDLGGGTFDLAVLEEDEEGTFRVARWSPRGSTAAGGTTSTWRSTTTARRSPGKGSADP